MSEPRIEFRPLRKEDLPLLLEWLNRPHVAEWWHDEGSLVELEAEYFPPVESPGDARPYIAYAGERPVGYIQSYVAADFGTGWWPGQHDHGVLGIDQFLTDPNDLGRGLGTALVERFTAFLFEDPAVIRIVVDPLPTNRRAIRCYEKAGFRPIDTITTPDGPALLMTLERTVLG